LSLNGRLFLVNSDDLETLTPALEQEGPLIGTSQALELFEAQEIAYIITLHDWKLFKAVNPNELIYQVFGRQNFNKITVNSDLLMRRFNEIQFWISTEICLCSNLAKRVALIKKFIKLAAQ
jgi:Rap guanine nucleotide exchange factor 4